MAHFKMVETHVFFADHCEFVMGVQLCSVTVAARSNRAFCWINNANFTTGLLVANVQEKIILEKNRAFPQPQHTDLFSNDANFTLDLFEQLFVVDCDPVLKGELSLQTEIIIIDESWREIGTMNNVQDDATLVKQQMPNTIDCKKDDECDAQLSCYLSDFLAPLSDIKSECSPGQILEKVAVLKKTRKRSFNCQLQVVESLAQFRSYLHQNNAATHCDISSTILVNMHLAQRLSLFDNEYIVVSCNALSKQLPRVQPQSTVCQVKITQARTVDVHDDVLYAFPTVPFALGAPVQEYLHVDIEVHIHVQIFMSCRMVVDYILG